MAKRKTRARKKTAARRPARAAGGGLGSVISKARAAGALVVDVRFTDLLGSVQHFTIPIQEFTADLETEGLGFDGSSIRGFQAINESDMLLLPDASSAFVDPCLQVPTLSLPCD